MLNRAATSRRHRCLAALTSLLALVACGGGIRTPNPQPRARRPKPSPDPTRASGRLWCLCRWFQPRQPLFRTARWFSGQRRRAFLQRRRQNLHHDLRSRHRHGDRSTGQQHRPQHVLSGHEQPARWALAGERWYRLRQDQHLQPHHERLVGGRHDEHCARLPGQLRARRRLGLYVGGFLVGRRGQQARRGLDRGRGLEAPDRRADHAHGCPTTRRATSAATATSGCSRPRTGVCSMPARV